MCGRSNLSIGSKGHNFLSDRWIALKFLQGFPEFIFLSDRGVYTKCILGDEDVYSTVQEYL
jgi:hypothetical protein